MKCQLIKLKSGEEIICDIGVTTKTKCELINPFVFKSTTMINPMGIPYDITTLKDWLSLSTSKKITIPSNHIVSIIQPSNSTKKLYRAELKRTRTLVRNTKKKFQSKSDSPDMGLDANDIVSKNSDMMHVSDKDFTNNDDLKDFIENLFGNLFNNESDNEQELNSEPTNPEDDFSDSMTPEDEYKLPNDIYNEAFPPRKRKSNKNRPLIQMNMMFPPEVIIDLMETGIINVNDVNKIAKEIKNKLKFTGDERHRKDFGNKMSDWNPDITSEDYK